MKFKVDMRTYAFAVIEVELEDAQLHSIAVDLEKDVANLTIDDLREYVAEKAYEQGVPVICVKCSGWGQSYGLELNDDWEITEDPPNVENRFSSIRLVK